MHASRLIPGGIRVDVVYGLLTATVVFVYGKRHDRVVNIVII